MKKSVAFFFSLTLIFFTAATGSAVIETVGDPGRSWSIPNDAERGMHVQEFIDSFPGEAVSYLVDNELRKDPFIDPTCKSVADARCKSPSLQYSALLPVCGPLSELYCIEEFGVVSSVSEQSKGVFSRYFPNQALNKFDASESLKLPYGSTGSIFDLPSATHEGGTSYYVSVLTQGSVSKNNGADLGGLEIRITPVKLETGDRAIQSQDSGFSSVTDGGGGDALGTWLPAGFGFSGDSFCVAGSAKEKLCAQRYAFPADKKFYLKLRMQNRPAGWMHGRIYKPEISFNQEKGFYSFSISAFPVAVPVVYKMYRYPEMPQALKDLYDYRTGEYKPQVAVWSPEVIEGIIKGGCGRSKCSENPLTRNKIIISSPSSKFGMEQLKSWLPFVEDKATALLGTWSMRTLGGDESRDAQRCFTDGAQGLTGVVTTNATQYSGGPPTYNNSEGTLEYSVAAPHLTPQNKVFIGSYDLIMRSDVARCVYGFSKAPIKASLSITSDLGDQKVETEALGEKDGWLYLSASGFTYSAPTIKVKLTQEKPKEVVVEMKPEAVKPVEEVAVAGKSKAPKKSLSIICSKGKVIKKVSGINPKCPAGYRKK
jgi:hypothetical protein